MNEIGSKIAEMILHYDGGQKKFAADIGLPPSVVSNWKTGKSTSYMKHLDKIANVLGITKAELIGDVDEKVTLSYKRIPVLGVIPAGIPIEAIEDILDFEDIPIEWTTGGREYFGLKVQGTSMYPVYLHGDTVILRKQPTFDNGDTCAVMVNGDAATLKQVYMLEDGSIKLKPYNTEYSERTYSPDEVHDLPVTIAGVVVELRRKIK